MELKLTTPMGLYFITLALTVVAEIVIGLIEIAMYFGVLYAPHYPSRSITGRPNVTCP